jgi:hypothetical protein
MTKSLLFKTAHKNTKEMKRNYPEVNYRVQFGLELKTLYANMNMTMNEHTQKWIKRAKRNEKLMNMDLNDYSAARYFIESKFITEITKESEMGIHNHDIFSEKLSSEKHRDLVIKEAKQIKKIFLER